MPEAWLRGPVEGVPSGLMPAAHSMLDAFEDIRAATVGLTPDQLWARPGGAASVGFHLRHICGANERLFTYARGEGLTSEQLAAIPLESEPGVPVAGSADLLSALSVSVDGAVALYRATAPETLSDARKVGRAGLESTVLGLLFHAAEHARRHAGQVIATSKILQGGSGDAVP